MGSCEDVLMREEGLMVNTAGWLEQARQTADIKARQHPGPAVLWRACHASLGLGVPTRATQALGSCPCYNKPQLQ